MPPSRANNNPGAHRRVSLKVQRRLNRSSDETNSVRFVYVKDVCIGTSLWGHHVKNQNDEKETLSINVQLGSKIRVGSKIRKWVLLILSMLLSLVADLSSTNQTNSMNVHRSPIENERMLGHQRPTASHSRSHKGAYHRKAEPGRCRDTGSR